eukprot:jgi/Psemu1/27640/gm1.27640_g
MWPSSRTWQSATSLGYPPQTGNKSIATTTIFKNFRQAPAAPNVETYGCIEFKHRVKRRLEDEGISIDSRIGVDNHTATEWGATGPEGSSEARSFAGKLMVWKIDMEDESWKVWYTPPDPEPIASTGMEATSPNRLWNPLLKPGRIVQMDGNGRS